MHPENRGYGGNQKTCYREALARGADVVVMVHPDHQYDPTTVPGTPNQSVKDYLKLSKDIEQGTLPAVAYVHLRNADKHFGQAVQGEVDAVVGDAALREVVGPDALAAIARADLQTAFLRLRGGLLGLRLVEQARFQQ